MNTFLALRSRGGGAAVLALAMVMFVAAALPGRAARAQPSSAPPAAGADALAGPPITPTEAAARVATAPGAADASATPAVRPPTEDDVRIDLVRNRSNRVVEVIVTPAHVPWHYAMVNRDTQPTTAQPGGLSTPRFFRFDF
jgi:hypothetical protein